MAKGERLLKDIYEALRAGPGWNKTLFWSGYLLTPLERWSGAPGCCLADSAS
jgi:hypothetical protein